MFPPPTPSICSFVANSDLLSRLFKVQIDLTFMVLFLTSITIALHELPYHFNKYQGHLFFKCYTLCYIYYNNSGSFLNLLVLRTMHPGYNLWFKMNSKSDLESSSIHEAILVFLKEITYYHYA